MGDALSHAVLPGIVVAFLVTSSRNPLLMLGGATVAGIITVVLIELIKRMGRVEPGAAMGVVFSLMFALGVLLIEKAAASSVDLDAECVLYGQLETLVWFGAPDNFADLMSWNTIDSMPRQLTLLAVMFVVALLFVGLLFKELRIAAFDPEMATSQGISARGMHYLLMVFVAAATVASFEAVGSILVIAVLIAPAAAARLLTDRLGSQIAVSFVAALICGVGGYFAATLIPGAFGFGSVNAAGSMAVVAGMLVVLRGARFPIARHHRPRLPPTAFGTRVNVGRCFGNAVSPRRKPRRLNSQLVKRCGHAGNTSQPGSPNRRRHCIDQRRTPPRPGGAAQAPLMGGLFSVPSRRPAGPRPRYRRAIGAPRCPTDRRRDDRPPRPPDPAPAPTVAGPARVQIIAGPALSVAGAARVQTIAGHAQP